MSTPDVLPSPVARLGEDIAVVFSDVMGWAGELRGHLEALHPEPVADLDDKVHRLVSPALHAVGPILGAGFVAAPGYLPDAPWHLAWWLSPANGIGRTARAVPARRGARAANRSGVRRLRTEEDPASEGFHDFTRLEWWRVPTASGMPHLTGPYVDYLCTDQLTVTITVPVRVRDVTAGVFGADLSVAAIERLAEAAWGQSPGRVTVVSRSGRVVTSSDPGLMAGALLGPGSDSGPAHAVHGLPGCWGTLNAVLG